MVLTRREVCCLLALAFFNAIEPQPGGEYQQLTFSGFLSSSTSRSQGNKLLCLLQYFERLRLSEEEGDEKFLGLCVSVTRRKLKPESAKSAAWKDCKEPLGPFECLSEGMIEDAHGCLQVDFANAFIGGGVLHFGTVQVYRTERGSNAVVHSLYIIWPLSAHFMSDRAIIMWP